MMHSDSRVKEPVCLATTSLPDPCLSTYLSPRFREEPKKTPAEGGGRAKCSQFLHIVSQRIFRLVPENLKKVVVGPFGNRKTEG